MKKNKLGFSLLEASVVMLIAAIFFVVISNVIPRKVSDKSMAESHGRFECYFNGAGQLVQQEFRDGAPTTSSPVIATNKAVIDGKERSYCEFDTSTNSFAKYFIFNLVGGGASGAKDIGGNAGGFSSSFFPVVSQVYWLFPGLGGAPGKTGDRTYVTNKGTGHVAGKAIIGASGGSDVASLDGLSVTDINKCYISETTHDPDFDCGETAECVIQGGKIVVHHCINASVKGFTEYSLLSGKAGVCSREKGIYTGCNYNSIQGNPWTVSGYETRMSNTHKPYNVVVWTFHDVSTLSKRGITPHTFMGGRYEPDINHYYAPSLFTLKLEVDAESVGETGAESKLYTLARTLDYSQALINQQPGNGGNAGYNSGKHGAVVVAW